MGSLQGGHAYRVWCLSWDDDEERGSAVVGYDIVSDGYKQVGHRCVYVPNYLLRDAADAAEAYASYAHSHRDGYESSWPLKFRVQCQDGSIQDFEVDREVVPEFNAVPVNGAVPITKEVKL
jgi:hypothetical protein